MSTYVLSIVEIIVTQATANTIFKTSSLIYTTDSAVYIYNHGKEAHMKMLSNPCGIKYGLKGIKTNNMETLYYGYPTDNRVELIYCLCVSASKKSNNCQ